MNKKRIGEKGFRFVKDADIYYKLGMLYEKTGQREKAIESWENGIEINPDSECLKNALETQ